VLRPRGEIETSLHFTPAGRVFLGTAGAGTWATTGPDRFSYRIAEPLLADGGAYTGWVDIRQDAVLAGDRLTSSGVSRVYDAEGNERYAVPVTVTAHYRAV
jgi:hypothetical protein